MIVQVCTRRELWAKPGYSRVLSYWLQLDSHEGIMTLHGRSGVDLRHSQNGRAGLNG